MPTVPKNNKCRELGCNNQKTSRSTFCNIHGGSITAKGKENSKLYSTAQWKKLRQIELSKSPLCVSCLSNGKCPRYFTREKMANLREKLGQFLAISHFLTCSVCLEW